MWARVLRGDHHTTTEVTLHPAVMENDRSQLSSKLHQPNQASASSIPSTIPLKTIFISSSY